MKGGMTVVGAGRKINDVTLPHSRALFLLSILGHSFYVACNPLPSLFRNRGESRATTALVS